PAGAESQVLARWDFSGGLGPTSTATGISANSVSVVGANPIYPPVYTGNPSPAAEARAWLGGRDNGRYYTFRVTNNLTVAVPVTRIRMDLRNESPGIGPTGFAVMSSADNYASDVASGSLDWSTRAWVNVNAKMNTVLQPGQALEFRVTGWGANSIPPQGGHLIMDNVVVLGGATDSDGDGLTDAWEIGYGRYQLIRGDLTWTQAKAAAVALGGHLGTITSSSEYDQIGLVVGPNPGGAQAWWIGASDAQIEGSWQWVTGEVWSYQSWYPGEPNNGAISNGNEDYAHIYNVNWRLWNDAADEVNSGNTIGYLFEFGYPTDPTKADTDGDGVNDKAETLAGTDPNSAGHASPADHPNGGQSAGDI
ncbi:MAG: hypothetical protein EBZ78_09585, partial [Verrucomicrobia bacterium]|nr:hypothetical protein [Verrucomicrobiota bacterium]